MNKKRCSSLRSVVKTWMNAAARLRHAEDVLRKAESGLPESSRSPDEMRCRILRDELRSLVVDAGIPPEIESVEEVVAYLLGDCALCSAAGEDAPEKEDALKDAAIKTQSLREESDDWTEFTKKPASAKKAVAVPRAAETGIRRLVIRKSSRTPK